MVQCSTDKIEESACVLDHEIEKLDALGLDFAAALVRIARLDLLMRLANASDEDVDLLSFAASLIKQKGPAPGGNIDELTELMAVERSLG